MKKFIKSFSICLIIIAMMSTTAFAAAPNDPAEPQSNRYIWTTTVGIVPLGNGKIEVDFSVTATGKMIDVGATHVQIFDASGKCVKIFSSTDPNYSYIMGHNDFTHTAGVTYQGVPGQRYYAIVTFFAGTIGGGGGGASLESALIKA